jgi:hypothetical protein
MRFDKTFLMHSEECSVIAGLNMLTDSALNCKNSTDGTYTYMKVNNFDSATVSNQIVLSLLVNTPITAGNYNVEIITGNDKGVMDRMTSVISLNSTYGKMDMLSINAVTSGSKVAVGKTGPL